MKTELLMNKELPSTTGKDIFNALNKFFIQNNWNWGKLVGCTTDDAPCMFGQKSGFQVHVKYVSPMIALVSCFMHRFALCANVLPPELLSCLN